MPGFGRGPAGPGRGPPCGRGMPAGDGREPPGPCGRGPPPWAPGACGRGPAPGAPGPPGRGPPCGRGACGRAMPVEPPDVKGLLPGRGPAGRAPPGRGAWPPGRGAPWPGRASRWPGAGRPPGRGAPWPGRGPPPCGRWPCAAAGLCAAAAGGAGGAVNSGAAGAGRGAGLGPGTGRGPEAAGAGVTGAGAGVSGACGAAGAAGACACGCGAAGRGAPGFGAAGRAACAGEGAAGLGAALRGADLPLPPPWNASVSLRTTGASIVEDAERTNSPSSWSLAMTTLLSTPNSLASSYTRTLATSLLLGPGVSGPSLLHGRTHRVLIECSSQSRPTSNSRGTRAARTFRTTLLTVLLLDVPAQRLYVQRTRGAQRPRECPAAHRLVQTDLDGVYICTPAGQRTARIGDAFVLDRHDPQQFGLGRSLPAPHTGALRACAGMRPARHC
jgi:hypothetical protein